MSTAREEATSKRRTAGRLVVLSNRGPLRLRGDGWQRSSGGLVTALDPLLRRREGTWVSVREELSDKMPELGYRQELVDVPGEMKDAYYFGVSNGVLWPTMHGFPTLGEVDEAPWADYESVNRRFAEAVLPHVDEADLLWVHDYHLMRTPRLLRNSHGSLRMGWFCHIPWPPTDQFATLPWRRELVDGVLGADVVGFHTKRYARHFLETAQAFADAEVDRASGVVRTPEGLTRVVVAPIGIPHDEVRSIVEAPDIMDRVRELQRAVGGRRIVLGVDRLDYTKGIPEKIAAFARLLEQDPSLIEELVLVQVVVPSREEVDAYSSLKRTLERVVGELNGRFGRTGRVAVHYLYQSLTPYELYAHYIASEVALVTPLRDGMNLVALEYIASRTLETGALVLSEFAGAAEYLSDAYLVNPYDIDAVCNALKRALGAPDEERRRRMRGLRARVAELDVHRWADRFLAYLQRPPV